MNKREFNKIINSCRDKAKTGLSIDKINLLADSVKYSMAVFIIKQRGPLLKQLITDNMDGSWLACMGYMHYTKGKKYEFIHTAEHKII